MSTLAGRSFTQAFDDARAKGLLNDAAKDVYTDAVLLPHGAFVHNEIQEEFAASGIPMAETTSTALTYAANAATIVVPGAVTDLGAPLEIWEKSQDDSLWVLMKQVADLRAPLDTGRALL